MRVAIFASGTGSNFTAICDAALEDVEVVLAFSDQPTAGVVDLARRRDIPTVTFSPRNFDTRLAYEEALVGMVRQARADLIVLAGYMRIIQGPLLAAYPGAIVNIHPSLLPAFPGKDAIGQAFSAGVETTGVTVHYVDAGMDTGPIIAQHPVAMCSELKDLEAAIHQAEHTIYPQVIAQLAKG